MTPSPPQTLRAQAWGLPAESCLHTVALGQGWHGLPGTRGVPTAGQQEHSTLNIPPARAKGPIQVGSCAEAKEP